MRSKAEDRVNRQRRAVPIAIRGAAMAIALLLITVPFTATAQTTYEFRMAHAEAIGTPITNAFEAWGKLLKERSGGRIDAKHFPAGQLGNYTQLIEGSRDRKSTRPELQSPAMISYAVFCLKKKKRATSRK